MRTIRLFFALLIAGGAVSLADARTGFAQRAAPAPPPQPTVVVPPPPYEPQLVRLAEIIGALHYLRTVCPGPENGAWRREMQALLDAEAGTAERRERLIESFNRGYRGYEQSHRTCTPAAQVATRRFAEEGQRLLGDLTSRYGN